MEKNWGSGKGAVDLRSRRTLSAGLAVSLLVASLLRGPTCRANPAGVAAFHYDQLAYFPNVSGLQVHLERGKWARSNISKRMQTSLSMVTDTHTLYSELYYVLECTVLGFVRKTGRLREDQRES